MPKPPVQTVPIESIHRVFEAVGLGPAYVYEGMQGHTCIANITDAAKYPAYHKALKDAGVQFEVTTRALICTGSKSPGE